MAYSLQQVVSDGSLNRITVSIDYIDKANISVYVDDIILPDGTYTWVWDGEDVVITPNVANASIVVVKRSTKFDLPYHDFSAGAVFKDSSIDENFRQMLFIAQEAAEGATATDFYQDLNFHGYRLTKVGNAVKDDDAVPFAQYRADTLGAFQQRTLAETARNQAVAAQLASEVARNTSVSAAASTAGSVAAASASASAAATSATTALGYRNEAETFKNTAGTSATNAGNSATAAAASAAAAAASAASINDADLVHKTGNETVEGIKTFTASPVLPGNATTALQAVPKQQLDAAIAASGGYQEFTVSGNFTVPAGVTSVYLTGIGGGGGGGTSSNKPTISAGGGGGHGTMVIRKKVTVVPETVYAVTIGSAAANVAGGATSFGALLSLAGGAAGITIINIPSGGGSGYPGGFSVGYLGGSSSGAGASTPFGLGGNAKAYGGAGTSLAGNPAAANSGAGGGGAITAANTAGASGGSGGTGYLIVEW